jgi:hypothetical protein
MHHVGGVLSKALNFTFYTRANGGIQPGKLRLGLAAYLGS